MSTARNAFLAKPPFRFVGGGGDGGGGGGGEVVIGNSSVVMESNTKQLAVSLGTIAG
jgi:hypothetical protein